MKHSPDAADSGRVTEEVQQQVEANGNFSLSESPDLWPEWVHREIREAVEAALAAQPADSGQTDLCDCDADKYNKLPHHADCAALAAQGQGDPCIECGAEHGKACSPDCVCNPAASPAGVPDGYVKPEEIAAYRRRKGKPRGTAGGGFGVFVSDMKNDIYSWPVYFDTAPPASPDDSARFRFIVENNWIGTKTRCTECIQDSDLESSRRAVDRHLLAAAPSAPEGGE